MVSQVTTPNANMATKSSGRVFRGLESFARTSATQTVDRAYRGPHDPWLEFATSAILT